MLSTVLTLLLFQSIASQGLPPELKAALNARQFLNARITWEVQGRAGGRDTVYWGIATYVGSQIAYETHYPDGPASSGLVDHAIIRGLYWEGRLLENNGDPLSARLLEDPRMGSGVLMDYRVLGMHSHSNTRPEHNPFEPAGDATPEYVVTKRSGLTVVSARERADGKALERRWTIDPQQGFNVALYEEFERGKPTVTVASTLSKVGEHWFPRAVEYRDGDGRLYLTIRVREVKLNDGSLPQRLTPEFIEVVPGTNVDHMFPDAPSERAAFDGVRFVSAEEFRRRLRAGEVQRGEVFVRGLDRLGEIGAQRRAAVKYTPSAWEKYVAQYIAEHRLDDGQANRAWAICRECRLAADQYLAKHRQQLDELQQRQEALKVVPNTQESAALAAKAAELRRPIEEIFDGQLLRRLDHLLTHKQRALGQPTSGPVTTGPSAG